MEYISVNPKIRSGEPCLSGTRLTVSDVLSIHLNGEDADYNLTQEQVDACFMYRDTELPEMDVEEEWSDEEPGFTEKIEIRFDTESLLNYRREYDYVESLEDLWNENGSLFTQQLPPLGGKGVDNKEQRVGVTQLGL